MKRFLIVCLYFFVFLMFFSCQKIDASFKIMAAQAAYNHGNFERAIDLYKELLKKKPNDAMLHWYVGTAYFSNKQFEECYEESDKLRILGRPDLAADLWGLLEKAKNDIQQKQGGQF